MAGMLALLLAMPLTAQCETARLVLAARTRRTKPKPVPEVSKARKELAQQMVRDSYELGRTVGTRRRVALMTRLLYTMRPEVMAAEKRQWAEELFGLAQQLPSGDPTGDVRRNSAIATAAARLSVYDADRALELLDALPSQGGQRKDARTMAARLVFVHYMQRHGLSGAQVLLTYGRKWGEHGGFPYAASAVAMGRLRGVESRYVVPVVKDAASNANSGDAAENFFRQVMDVFARGQEGVYGVREFAGLLERGVVMEAVSGQTADEAGRLVVMQLRKLAESNSLEGSEGQSLSEEQKGQVAFAVNDVRLAAPQAYEQAHRDAPWLFAMKATPVSVQLETPPVDVELQTSFHELAEAMRAQRNPEELGPVIRQGLQVVNARYKAGKCAGCLAPDAQSWALVSLAAYAAPITIGGQLSAIEDPFWRAYFMAIAAQQVGEPARVADPTARKVPGKEEAEPE
jgi:hypothetical protein